jgi:homoserine dehydrogenase
MKIAILGYGVIGKGVYEIISKKEDIEVIKILEREEKFDKTKIELFTNNIENIINDNEIELVVEVLGGYDFAYNCIKKCLEAKKHVVTANKEVVAKSIDTLTSLAKENNVIFQYEASVGGGIPIIKNLVEIIKTSEITEITGILNGTTNFILTKINEGMNYNEALKLAQQLGFAESDPTADVEGFDMMRKIAILSDLSWNTKIELDDITHIGLTSLKDEDYNNAKANNKVIKYISFAKKENNNIEIGIKPIYIEKNHILASVNNETNCVILKTTPNDELIFIGKGAGSLPTAASVVGDIYNIIYNRCICEYKNINKFEINRGK